MEWQCDRTKSGATTAMPYYQKILKRDSALTLPSWSFVITDRPSAVMTSSFSSSKTNVGIPCVITKTLCYGKMACIVKVSENKL